MRRALMSLVLTSALAAVLSTSTVAPAVALNAAADAEARQISLDAANQVNELAVRVRNALNPERCLSAEEALATIQTSTAGADISTIAGVIKVLLEETWWCDTVRAALVAADEAAQLALASSVPTGNAATGAVAPIVFASGGMGAPGGGGGSGYLNN